MDGRTLDRRDDFAGIGGHVVDQFDVAQINFGAHGVRELCVCEKKR